MGKSSRRAVMKSSSKKVVCIIQCGSSSRRPLSRRDYDVAFSWRTLARRSPRRLRPIFPWRVLTSAVAPARSPRNETRLQRYRRTPKRHIYLSRWIVPSINFGSSMRSTPRQPFEPSALLKQFSLSAQAVTLAHSSDL